MASKIGVKKLEDEIFKRVTERFRQERLLQEFEDSKRRPGTKVRAVQAVTWGTEKGKPVTQYTVTIPKEYAELAGINSKDYEVVFQCKNISTTETPKYQITAEIKKTTEK